MIYHPACVAAPACPSWLRIGSTLDKEYLGSAHKLGVLLLSAPITWFRFVFYLLHNV